MAGDTFGFLTDQSTLWAVVLGAILATIGGFVATALERVLDRRERERNAALFFGEVLSTLTIIISFAEDTRKIGDPYGPITMRMVSSARREIEIYDRNRESLFYLRQPELRAKIQTLIIRLIMPLDALIESAAEKTLAETELRLARDDGEREHLQTSIAERTRRQETAFGFVLETTAQLKPVIAGLEPLAKHSFDRIDRVARSL